PPRTVFPAFPDSTPVSSWRPSSRPSGPSRSGFSSRDFRRELSPIGFREDRRLRAGRRGTQDASEIGVTGPKSPEIKAPEDLSGKRVQVLSTDAGRPGRGREGETTGRCAEGLSRAASAAGRSDSGER